MKTKIVEQDKFKKSVSELKAAMKYEKQALTDPFFFAGISKSFEVCLEYAWKYFKRRAVDEGLEIYSPKEAVKAAGKIKIIDDVEKWLDFIEDRNLAVHDYLGVSDAEYLKTIKEFLVEVEKVASLT